MSVVAGGLLQDLEEQLRRNLAPIEERVRPGEETRGLAGGAGTGIAAGGGGASGPGLADDVLVIVLPADPANRPVDAQPEASGGDRA